MDIYSHAAFCYNPAMASKGKPGISPLLAVIISAAVFAAFFGTICVLRYRAYTYPDYDFTINIQKYWSILHSNGRVSLLGDVNVLGNSFEFIAYPMSVVYFLLFQSQESLLFLQPLVVACGALVIYKIARLKLSGWWSACVSISFLMNPATWYMVLGQYYDLIFCIIPLGMAFFYLKKDMFGKFAACLLVSILFRADISLVIFMFGIYAAVEKKKARWIVFPVALSLAWISVFVLWLRPHIYPRVYYEAFYGSAGSGFLGALYGMASDPLKTISAIFTWQNTVFVFKMLLPMIFLPIFSAKELLIPALAVLRQSMSSFAQHHNIVLHNASFFIMFLYAASAFGLAKILGKKEKISPKDRGVLFFLIIAVPIATNIWYGPLASLQAYRFSIRKTAMYGKVDRMIEKIPADAPVVSSFEFSSHLANREKLYFMHNVTDTFLPFPYQGYRVPGDAEYAIANFSRPVSGAVLQKKNSDILVREYIEGGGFGPIDIVNNVCLLKKGAANNDNFLYKPDYGGPLPATPLIEIGKDLAVVKWDMNTGDGMVAATFYFKCLKKTDEGVYMFLQVFDENGKEVDRMLRPVCYGIYPVNRWKGNEAVVDRFRLFFSPERVEPGRRHTLKAVFISTLNTKNIPLSSGVPGMIDREGRMVVGNFEL